MASAVKFEDWVHYMVEAANLESDQLVIALTAAANAPSASANALLGDLTQITYTNLSSRNVTTTSSSEASGTYTLVLQDLTLTASGSVGPFRYVVLYDDTVTNDPLMMYWDYGSDVTLASSETFDIDFAATTISLS